MQYDTVLMGRHDPQAIANILVQEDIPKLVELLNEKADDIRYAAFLILCARSETQDDIYPYWDTFAQKMSSDNSYQRSIGCMLIARNIKWDTEGRFANAIETYLSRCQDEKFITSRQAIQAILLWAPHAKPHLAHTAQVLMDIDVVSLKPTQIKLILLDILHALIAIRQIEPDGLIDAYIHRALTGGLLDKKSASQIQELLK